MHSKIKNRRGQEKRKKRGGEKEKRKGQVDDLLQTEQLCGNFKLFIARQWLESR